MSTTDPETLFLVGNALDAARRLAKRFPGIVFTSGRRGVPEQAHAMASNIVSNRNWIVETYRRTPSSEELQAWVNDNPTVTGIDALTAGLTTIMQAWTDEQKSWLSSHFSGNAFDLHPLVDGNGHATTYGESVIAAVHQSPGLSKFLTHEGGLARWHAQFVH